MYALSKDGASFRAIGSKDELQRGETFSERQPEIKAPPLTREQVEVNRLRAYADPLTGADRYRNEAAAERAAGNEEKAKEVEAKWLSRREEIAAENPWPEESV